MRECIETRPGNPSGLERRYQSAFIDNRTAGRIHEQRKW